MRSSAALAAAETGSVQAAGVSPPTSVQASQHGLVQIENITPLCPLGLAAISNHFAEPWRADRIKELLNAGDSWTPEQAGRVLLDSRQLGAEALLRAISELGELSSAAEELRATLAVWDLEMAVDSVGAASFTTMRDHLALAICATAPMTGLADASAYGPMYEPWLSLPARVGQSLPSLLAHGEAIGLDMPALVREAIETAAVDVRPWGERHGFAAPSGLAQVGLDDASVPVTGEPLAGDVNSVLANGWIPGTNRVPRGPVARYVWDLADRDNSRWAVPLGASGVPGDPHQVDQFEAWHSGSLLPVVTDWDCLRHPHP